jgi:hypothetical protein
MKGKLSFGAGRWLVLLGLLASALVPAHTQSRPIKERLLPGAYPAHPSQPSMAKIPVEPLGFTPPGPLYLGQRNSLVSLDFIGEDRLLFTFRVPGLIHRQLKVGESDQTDERQIRAVVLHLPDGNVEAEGLWTVHDRGPYVWMLKDGHFLFRDEENLQEGDEHLDMKPLLQFPGPLLWLEVDPTEQFLVSNSSEPAAKPAKAGTVDSPATTQITITPTGEAAEGDSDHDPSIAKGSGSGQDAGSDASKDQTPAPFDYVVRILRRDGGQVLLVSRVRQLVHLPINSQGYLDSLRGRGLDWALNLNFFTGGSRILGSVESACAPNMDFLSDKEVIVTGCDSLGAHKLVAVTTEGKTLWANLNPDTAIWPLLVRSPDGQRLLQETLAVNRPISSYAPLSADDIKGQLVRVFDAATGDQVFESPASPILDAGGNVALSPTSRRVAVLNGSAIEVFDLPAPAAQVGAQKTNAK